MGKLTVDSSAKTNPEDAPPYPLEPLPTKPGLQTNIVVPEPVPGIPPAQVRRCPKKCGTITLVTVCVVLVVALILLGVKLGKKHMMAGKLDCDESGEKGHMGRDCDEMEDMDEVGGESQEEHDGEHDEGDPRSLVRLAGIYINVQAHTRRCPKKCKTITLVSVCVVLVVALIVVGVMLCKKRMMAGKPGCEERGEKGRMGKDCDEMEDMEEMGDESQDGQDGEHDEDRGYGRRFGGGSFRGG
ncbi:Hypp1924 [Branchiostoma lanceolatum]|uniref:Hypp1924 protein n=1 Tax=Branchiostoma lanceolatum TaxID=7740 RepID=A0A8K0EQI4_BRALA|nr:Hypp1924 [Branchiostoma lanceolatum]